jgi:hypothetical protein
MIEIDLQKRLPDPSPSWIARPSGAPRPRIVEVNAGWSAKQFISENWKWFMSGIGGVIFAAGGYFGKRWTEGPKPGASP